MIKHVQIFCSMFWMNKTNNSMISTVPVMVPNIENAPSTDPAGRRCASVWWIVIGAFSEHTWSDCIFIGTLNTSCVCMILLDFTVFFTFYSPGIHVFSHVFPSILGHEVRSFCWGPGSFAQEKMSQFLDQNERLKGKNVWRLRRLANKLPRVNQTAM